MLLLHTVDSETDNALYASKDIKKGRGEDDQASFKRLAWSSLFIPSLFHLTASEYFIKHSLVFICYFYEKLTYGS